MDKVEKYLLEWLGNGAKQKQCPFDVYDLFPGEFRVWVINYVDCYECLDSIGLGEDPEGDCCPCYALGHTEALRRAVQVIHNMEVGDIYF